MSYLYRVRLVATEVTPAKSRVKNLGELSKFETNEKRAAQHEVTNLHEMVSKDSWQVPCRIIVERAEVSEYVEVDSETCAPFPRGIPPVPAENTGIDTASDDIAQSDFERMADHMQSQLKEENA